jgi:hypothetical protein
MKRKLLFFLSIILIALFGACKKDSNAPDGSSAPNVVTLNIDGKQYTATGNKWGQGSFDRIESTITKYSDGTADFYMYILIMGGGKSDFVMIMDTKKGPGNGLGNYQINSTGTFTEKFSGGESYTIAGGTVIITKSEASLIEGEVTLQLKNSNRTKAVTGTFVIKEPIN